MGSALYDSTRSFWRASGTEIPATASDCRSGPRGAAVASKACPELTAATEIEDEQLGGWAGAVLAVHQDFSRSGFVTPPGLGCGCRSKFTNRGKRLLAAYHYDPQAEIWSSSSRRSCLHGGEDMKPDAYQRRTSPRGRLRCRAVHLCFRDSHGRWGKGPASARWSRQIRRLRAHPSTPRFARSRQESPCACAAKHFECVAGSCGAG